MSNYFIKDKLNNICAKVFKMSKNLTKRSEDYSKWYNELVVKADLAENSGVRGCMVIKPYGYAIWEKMQKELKDLLQIQLQDNVKARILDNELRNQYVNPRNQSKIRSQVETYNYLYRKLSTHFFEPLFTVPV